MPPPGDSPDAGAPGAWSTDLSGSVLARPPAGEIEPKIRVLSKHNFKGPGRLGGATLGWPDAPAPQLQVGVTPPGLRRRRRRDNPDNETRPRQQPRLAIQENQENARAFGFYLLQASWCIRHWQVCLSECNAYRFRGEVARQGSPQVLACMTDVTAVVAILSTFKQEWFIRSC